jgi:hypothetical protein
MEVYKFDTMEDYEHYSPCQDSPNSIKNEIGLCKNYNAGI